MQLTARNGRRVLLSTVSSDAHTWNLVFLQLLLEEHGHEVINLGPCVPDALVLEAVRRHRPDALVVSSVNGHGFLDGVRLARTLRADPVARNVPAMIGGKLGVLGDANQQYARELVEAGFDAVFTDADSPESLTSLIGRLPQRPVLSAAEPATTKVAPS
ncbi:cobalamin-dependent protein [Streptomyces sp. NPDC047046]|uniref:cobalamin B12-binding domain-containing protein n=1 Tax=Streptomyces sp. NPDC047046 TaxID=3155378 RepID=UPI0033C092AA